MYVYGTQTCALNSKDAYFLLTFSIIFTQLSSFAAGPPCCPAGIGSTRAERTTAGESWTVWLRGCFPSWPTGGASLYAQSFQAQCSLAQRDRRELQVESWEELQKGLAAWQG